MPRTRNPYPSEFREKLVGLAKSGRNVESLARKYESYAATIHGWIRQAEIDDGHFSGGPTTEERDELRRLHREVNQLRQERDILSKVAAWFAQGELTSSTSLNS